MGLREFGRIRWVDVLSHRERGVTRRAEENGTILRRADASVTTPTSPITTTTAAGGSAEGCGVDVNVGREQVGAAGGFFGPLGEEETRLQLALESGGVACWSQE